MFFLRVWQLKCALVWAKKNLFASSDAIGAVEWWNVDKFQNTFALEFHEMKNKWKSW